MTPAVHSLYVQAHALLDRNALNPADALITKALDLAPGDRHLLNMRAAICASLHRLDEAEAIWRALLQDAPDDHQLLCNLGLHFQRRKLYPEAEEMLERAVALNPRHLSSRLNLGVLYAARHRYAAAMASYEAALELEPENAQVLFSIGCCLQSEYRLPEAHAAYERALKANPHHHGARSNLVFTQHYLPDFDPSANRAEAARLGASLAEKATLADRPVHHAGGLAAGKTPLRVGFVSPDLSTHPVGYFLHAMLAAIEPGEVSLHAYANSRTYDAMSARLRPAFDVWHQTIDWSDEELMRAIVDDGIDILIDLAGHSKGNRLDCFARRLAPVQMTWLGYFSTTGVATIDYVLADPVCLPPHEERFFTEKVLRLPHTRYCFSPLETQLVDRSLPSSRFLSVTFGCYQALPKINSRVLQAWAQILVGAPEARLRIRSTQLDQPAVVAGFRDRLEKLGLPLDRIETLPPLPYESYLQSHADIDVLLDTFPYPGGTTTAEALYLGVPTVTLAQPGMLGRQGEAIMVNGGFGGWVCEDEGQYIAMAVAIGRRESPRLGEAADMRSRAPAHVDGSPLYGAVRFARDWLDTLRRAWQLAASPVPAAPTVQTAPSADTDASPA